MISVELKGYKPLSRKLRWIRKNWPEVRRFVMMRMAQELAEELGIDDRWVKHIRVETSSKRTWYGLSVEPSPFDAKPDKYPDKLYYLVPQDGADEDLLALAEGNPYTASNLPTVLDPEKGLYFLRDSTKDELAEAKLRNLIYMDMNGITPTATSHNQPLQDDIRYNQARGGLGIGDDSSRRPIWREGFKKLIQKRLPEIVDEVTEAMISGKLRESDLPEFEDKSEEWLEDNSDFMRIAAKV